MSMVKFGADEIFKGKGSVLTDKDIDTILADGEVCNHKHIELYSVCMACIPTCAKLVVLTCEHTHTHTFFENIIKIKPCTHTCRLELKSSKH